MSSRWEDKSTEEAIAQLHDAQKLIHESGDKNCMVGSLHVCALYPSLHQSEAAQLAANLVLDSPTAIEGVCYRSAQVFLASNMSTAELRKEGIVHLVPGCRCNRGCRPGPTTVKLSTKFSPGPQTQPEAESSKWAPTNPDMDLTDGEKRLLVSKLIKKSVENVFANHLYQFWGRSLYKWQGAL